MKSRHFYRNTCVDKNALRSNICITFWFQYFLREKKEYMRHWLWFFSVRNIGLTCKHEFWCYGGHIYICDFNHVKFCKSFFTIYINSEEQYLKWSIGMIILSRIYYGYNVKYMFNKISFSAGSFCFPCGDRLFRLICIRVLKGIFQFDLSSFPMLISWGITAI